MLLFQFQLCLFVCPPVGISFLKQLRRDSDEKENDAHSHNKINMYSLMRLLIWLSGIMSKTYLSRCPGWDLQLLRRNFLLAVFLPARFCFWSESTNCPPVASIYKLKPWCNAQLVLLLHHLLLFPSHISSKSSQNFSVFDIRSRNENGTILCLSLCDCLSLHRTRTKNNSSCSLYDLQSVCLFVCFLFPVFLFHAHMFCILWEM